MKIFSRTKEKLTPPDLAPPPRRFSLLKFILLLGLLAILTSFILPLLWPSGSPSILSSWWGETSLSSPNLFNVRVIGRDRQDRFYVLTASRATSKNESNANSMLNQSGQMANIQANLELQPDQWLLLKSAAGHFDASRQQLSLTQTFDLYWTEGYQAHGTQAFIDLHSGTMIVQGLVEGWGPIGEITAAALEAKNDGTDLHFYGGVNLTLYPPAHQQKKE